MPRNNMPADWVPPVPAWQSHWQDRSDALVAGYFGIQSEDATLLDEWARTAFHGEHPPLSVERGVHADPQTTNDCIYIAYWRRRDYRKWWAKPEHSGWWNDPQRLGDGVGYWREIVTMPFDRFETLHSTQTPHGVGVSADAMDGPIDEHGYPGGMRDRIPLSDHDSLQNPNAVTGPLKSRVSDGGRRVLVTPPQYMCVIRSGQDWSACDTEEKQHYLKKLHPVLLKGMRFLRENPMETRCYSLRFVEQKDTQWGATELSFGLGYAVDVHAFEAWAKSHPTHLAIFGGFLNMVETFGPEMKLQLWHEVTSLAKADCEFEYIACHSSTGLLNYI